MKGRLVFTVGNPMMGDDAAGALLARMLHDSPAGGWQVLDGGVAPESVLYRIREMAPGRVLVVDAADMDLAPGEIRLIGPDRIDDPFILTTHTLPLSYLMQSLMEFVPRVELLGIQPRLVAFGFPVSREVRQAVERVYADLQLDEPGWQALPAAGRIP
jgi:hydrogenase 3 maturation protease